MLAYWRLQHSTESTRNMLSAPATYNDILHGLLVSRGVDPSTLGTTRRQSTRNAPRASSRPVVNVVGGQTTQAHQTLGESFHRANFKRDFAAQSGSPGQALDWWLSDA